MPTAGNTKKKPKTEGGRKVLEFCVEKAGAINRAARQMGIDNSTLRHRIYLEKPSRIDAALLDKFLAFGLKREWLGIADAS